MGNTVAKFKTLLENETLKCKTQPSPAKSP